MKNLSKFLLSLSAAILIAVFLYGHATQPAKVFAFPGDVTSSNVVVNEGDGNAVFTFSIVNTDTTFPKSYGYLTTDGSATNPADYTSQTGIITFQSFTDTPKVNIPIIDDTLIEPSENFTITVYDLNTDNNIDLNSPVGSWTGTIIDNDTAPTATPSATPTPTTLPSNPGGPGDGRSDGRSSCPSCTSTPPSNPAPTTTPTTPVPTPFVFTFLPTEDVLSAEVTPSPTSAPSIFPTILPAGQAAKKTPRDVPIARPLLVQSVLSPADLPHDIKTLGLSAAAALFLVLLIVFPAEIFNATVQSNYEEISRWSLVHRTKMYTQRLSKLPALFLVSMFAIISSIINSFLSPDIGFNTTTLVMVLGMLLALIAVVTIYDLTRMIYMKKRFGIDSKLRAHSIGLFTGTLLVLISRLSNFLPGYCYGLFTGLVYGSPVKDKEVGEGLAASAAMLLAFGILGWFLWTPIKDAALANNPSFLTLVFDSAFASFWISALTATIFGLLPMRFVYGEQVKKWNSTVWALIYFTGVFLFVYTLLNPAIGIYGKTDKASWIAVLSLFFGFGIFSISFWGYFRYRPQRKA